MLLIRHLQEEAPLCLVEDPASHFQEMTVMTTHGLFLGGTRPLRTMGFFLFKYLSVMSERQALEIRCQGWKMAGYPGGGHLTASADPSQSTDGTEYYHR